MNSKLLWSTQLALLGEPCSNLFRMVGIYKITCTKNGKFYIGSSSDLAARWISHTAALFSNSHHNYRIQEDYNLFGIEFFKFEIIQTFENFIKRKDLLLLEEGYIATLKPQYNIRKTTGCDEFKNKKRGKRKKNSRKKRFANKTFKNLYAR